jgi:transcriptional regulator with XRE-family HTH domain
MKTQQHIKKIGEAMKLIRNSTGESADAIARKLNYKNSSAYLKLERGEMKTLCIEKILIFCAHFKINMMFLFILADINVFEFGINTWAQFYESLSTLNEEDKTRILKLAAEFLPPYKINRLRQNINFHHSNLIAFTGVMRSTNLDGIIITKIQTIKAPAFIKSISLRVN